MENPFFLCTKTLHPSVAMTASKYLDALDAGGFVQKNRIGRSNYYVNLALNRILLGN